MKKGKHEPVELTASAKRKLTDAKLLGLLSDGGAKKAGKAKVKRDRSNASAMDTARKILMNAQSTDSHQ